MHTPYRIASPPVPERTEEADSYEEQLLAGRRRYWAQMALIVSSVITLGVLAVGAWQRRPTGAQKARRQESLRIQEARATVVAARADLDRAQQAFDGAIQVAVAHHLAPTTPLDACPIAIGDPEHLARGQSMVPLLVVSAEKPRSHYWSPSVEHAAQDVKTAEDLLEGVNPMSAVVYADALAATPISARLKRDVVVVASHWQSPTPSSNTAFVPGQVDGIAYVFDFDTRHVACAGEIHASSSRSLAYTYNTIYDTRGVRLEKTLEEDLDLQIARSVAEPNVLFATR